jgi:hypothetical protein
MLLERARQAEPPAAASQYRSPKTRLLIALCRQLQQEAGDGPFFLSTTTVEKLLGPNRMRAWRWLQGLVRDRAGMTSAISGGCGRRAPIGTEAQLWWRWSMSPQAG